MKILLYQKEDMHTEVMGFFLHYYRDSEIHICHRYRDSPFNWISTFEDAIGVQCTYVAKPVFGNYDKIVFITSRNLEELVKNGKFQGIDPSRVLQIRHTSTDKWAEGYPNIALTPLIPAENGSLLTTFPQLRRYSDEIKSTTRWVFTVVGLSDYSYPKKDVEGLKSFMQTLDSIGKDYVVQIITRQGKKVEESLTHPRVKFLYNLNCKDTGTAIKNSHFILPIPKRGGPYFRTLMTGIIPLALSYGVPLLAQVDYLDIYDLEHQPGVWNSLSEYAWALGDDNWYMNVATAANIDADTQQEKAIKSMDMVNYQEVRIHR